MKPCIEVYAPEGRAAEYCARVLTEPEPDADAITAAAHGALEVLREEVERRRDVICKVASWALARRGGRLAVFVHGTGQTPAGGP